MLILDGSPIVICKSLINIICGNRWAENFLPLRALNQIVICNL